ncbi:efflux RND transporter permease subunit [Chitinivibrio alkaliphilus]|uniref:AcrB/AcrD/AcrF family cation efflux protein n=1 Tax=Chitinivibrio alkaliphilus ACht1 TaxID=1313304 RepID=U7DAA8_9BACT|nr:efflux RND transporter permease subunit [Chitinivibrio alkaliphilus]ERP38962.1 AcrB/AcrD/AcrF family cation efflux protein [Chitinivibrio alkaliphilus ACht1]
MNKWIDWMVENHVTVNLLMLLIIVGGALSYLTLPRKIFPDAEIPVVTVTVPYPGASPDQIEQSVLTVFEDAFVGISGVRRISSTASEGVGSIFLEIEDNVESDQVRTDVTAAIDRIETIPEDSREPRISVMEIEIPVMQLGIYGDMSEQELAAFGERMVRDLRGRSGISRVDLFGVREYEMSLEVTPQKLEKYNISFEEIEQAVRGASLDLPGGKISSSHGEITLRTRDLSQTARDFERIIVRSWDDGSHVRVEDLGTVIDGFADVNLYTGFNGKDGAFVVVSRVGDQSALDIAQEVNSYVEETRARLPEGVELIVWEDFAEVLQDRLGLLLKNGGLGFILVLLVLGIFLDIRLAFWVAVGMAISFMGGLWAMTLFGVSINVISLFGFIMVLGIVVDDAIVIGENIFQERERGTPPVLASKRGTKSIAIPVVFAVLTTAATFSPLLAVEGVTGRIMYSVPVVVISVLLFSLFESLFILPAHLSTLREESTRGIFRISQEFSRKADRNLRGFIERIYVPLLQKSMRWPSLVIALSVAILIFFIALIAGGRVAVQPGMGNREGVSLRVFLTMPQGTSLEGTRAMTDTLLGRFDILREEFQDSHDRYASFDEHILVSIGEQPSRGSMGGDDPTIAEINILFPTGDERDYSLEPLQNRFREITADIRGYDELQFSTALGSGQDDINISLSFPDDDALLSAVHRLEDTLSRYDGVFDISNNFEGGAEELSLRLRSSGRSLGLTQADLARQVRTAFHGSEVLRVLRDEHDIPFMIRYPADIRGEVGTIHSMKISTPAGERVPITEVADIVHDRGYSFINRVNQNRVITVTAAVNTSVSNPGTITRELVGYIEGDMQQTYPGLEHVIGGQQEDSDRSLASLAMAFIVAMFVVYALLAIPFKSYLEPFIIMCAIPFGAIGAFIGHIVLGYDLQFMSIFGIVALSGVVVNDSLVFVDYVNRQMCRGLDVRSAILAAGRNRFRPILLTTLTTFAGLLPMLFETSFQAQMLIPMAISLGVGILFASAITLFLVPAYLILLDWIRTLFSIQRVCLGEDTHETH